MPAIPFKAIRARAEKRKGGAAALEKWLPKKPDMKALAKWPMTGFWRR